MFQTIVVAVDCGAIAPQVLSTLNQLQIGTQTQIILAHVLPMAEPDRTELDLPRTSGDFLYQSVEEQLQAYQAQISGAKIEIMRGDPALEIVRLANITQADLIILGTRGLQGVDRIIADSVSAQVVSDAPCSVLVVKAR